MLECVNDLNIRYTLTDTEQSIHTLILLHGSSERSLEIRSKAVSSIPSSNDALNEFSFHSGKGCLQDKAVGNESDRIKGDTNL